MELRDRVALHIIVGVPYEHAHFRVVERKYIIDKVTKTNDHIEPQFSEPSVSACRARAARTHGVGDRTDAGSQSLCTRVGPGQREDVVR
jgi:hypothetical protein